jgi:hypothetical protein
MKKYIILFAFFTFTISIFSQAPSTVPSTTPPLVIVSNQARLKEVNKTMYGFVKELHALNIVEARKFLAASISVNATDAHLESLSKNIKRNDELIVFNQNMEQQANGTGPVLIEYKYKSETETPEIFTVTFDEFNKITGFNSSKPNTYQK